MPVEASELHREPIRRCRTRPVRSRPVERRDTLGDTGGMVVCRAASADAVAKPDLLRALPARGQENLRRRGMRVFLKEVVLDFPGVIDAELVGQLDLVERFLEQPVLVAVAHGRGNWCS